MIAESRVVAFSLTILYVVSEIIPAGRPFLGFTWKRSGVIQAGRTLLTVTVEVVDDLGEVFLRLFMQV